MNRDIILKKCQSSFLSIEKDINTILEKLFITSRPYSDILKKLLVINTKDCLDNTSSEVINNKIKEMSLAKLKQEGYIKLEPKIKMPEHEEIKSYMVISFDNFTLNETNPFYRDCTLTFDIFCHTDCWDLGDYRLRPLKIVGYIDGILNNAKLSGIGTVVFMGCSEIVLDENLSGYSLSYRLVHGNDDKITESE